MNHLILQVVCVLSATCVCCLFGQGMDSTVQEKATGAGVVSAALRKIKDACLFENDYYFMRRVAWVESHFGADAGSFDQSEPKGIWQLSANRFSDTQNTSAHPGLNSLYMDISAQLGINWQSMSYSNANMNKALYNALATRIYLNNKAAPIPVDAENQANFWYSQYSIKPGASAARFLKELNSMPQCRSAGVDLILVLDGSGSIGYDDFQKMKSVIYQIINSTDIGLNRTKVALFVFSSSVTKHVSFSDAYKQNKNSLLNLISNLDYPSGGTNTADALAVARGEFLYARNMSLGFPRQLIILTDGESNYPDATAIEAAKLRNLTWLESYAIGMGSSFTGAGPGLQEITNIASLPTCTHVITTPTVAQISALTDDLRDASCQATAPICELTNCSGTISGQTSPGDVRYFREEADRQVGRSYRLNSNRWTMRLYVSARFENPGEGLYDFKSEARPGSPAQVYVSPQFLQSVGYSGLLSLNRDSTRNVRLYLMVETQSSSDFNARSAGFSIDTVPGDKYEYKPDAPVLNTLSFLNTTHALNTKHTLTTTRAFTTTYTGVEHDACIKHDARIDYYTYINHDAFTITKHKRCFASRHITISSAVDHHDWFLTIELKFSLIEDYRFNRYNILLFKKIQRS